MQNLLFWGLNVTLGSMCILHVVDAIKLIFIDKAVKNKSVTFMYAVLGFIMLGFYLYAIGDKRDLSLLPLTGILLSATTITSRYNVDIGSN